MKRRMGNVFANLSLASARQMAASIQRHIGATLKKLLRVSLRLSPFIGLLGILGLGYWGLTSSPYFRVRTITVEGVKRVSSDEIRNALAFLHGQNIFAVDRDAAILAVKHFSWIKTIQIKWELPQSIRVIASEYDLKALVLLGQLYLVDADGDIFKRASVEETAGKPIITGIDRQTFLKDPKTGREQIQRALSLIHLYSKNERPALSEIHLGQPNGFTMYLSQGGVAIHLAETETETRLRQFDAVWAALGPEHSNTREIFLDYEVRKDRIVVRMNNSQAD